MRFEQKTIWITGASSGIGEALALEWSKHKPILILSGRNLEKLDQVKSSCEKGGATCMTVKLDLTDSTSIKNAVSEVIAIYPKIDILVNNGGISQRATVLDASVEVDRLVMETNFFGAITLTKMLLPEMVKHKSGHIVVLSSIVGKFGFPLRSAYSASKHALQGFFDSLRAEMVKDNICVTIISPGRIATNISLNAVDKDGHQYGVMDPGQAKGMPADVCAKKIVRAVARHKKDILIGRTELFLVYIKRFLPALYYKIASKVSPT
jgi:dehydrogenase/reductase SDR family member 7B